MVKYNLDNTGCNTNYNTSFKILYIKLHGKNAMAI